MGNSVNFHSSVVNADNSNHISVHFGAASHSFDMATEKILPLSCSQMEGSGSCNSSVVNADASTNPCNHDSSSYGGGVTNFEPSSYGWEITSLANNEEENNQNLDLNLGTASLAFSNGQIENICKVAGLLVLIFLTCCIPTGLAAASPAVAPANCQKNHRLTLGQSVMIIIVGMIFATVIAIGLGFAFRRCLEDSISQSSASASPDERQKIQKCRQRWKRACNVLVALNIIFCFLSQSSQSKFDLHRGRGWFYTSYAFTFASLFVTGAVIVITSYLHGRHLRLKHYLLGGNFTVNSAQFIVSSLGMACQPTFDRFLLPFRTAVFDSVPRIWRCRTQDHNRTNESEARTQDHIERGDLHLTVSQPPLEEVRMTMSQPLESQLTQLKEDPERAKDQLNSSESLKRKAQEEVEESKRQLEDMSKKVEESQQKLEQCQHQLEESKQQVLELSAVKESQQQLLETANKTIEAFQADGIKIMENNKSLVLELDQSRTQLKSLEHEKSESCRSEANLCEELSRAKVNIEELRLSLMEKESRLQIILEENERLNSRVKQNESNREIELKNITDAARVAE